MFASKKRYRALGLLWLVGMSIPPTLAGAADALPTQDTNTAGIVAEFTEAKRKEGVLNVKLRLRNTSSQKTNIYVISSRNYDHYYVVADGKKYFILRDSEKVRLSPSADGGGNLYITIPPGGSWTWWAKYPAPPATVKTMTYFSPIAPPFDDVPITDR